MALTIETRKIGVACGTHAGLRRAGLQGSFGKDRSSDKEARSKFPCTARLRHCSATFILPEENLGLGLLRMYKARRPACLMRLLGTRVAFGEGRDSDKEARNEIPSTTCDSDIVQPFPCYQKGSWGLDYSECTRVGGTHAGCGCSGLQGVSEGKQEGYGGHRVKSTRARVSDFTPTSPCYQQVVLGL